MSSLTGNGIHGRGGARCIQMHLAADQLIRRDAPQYDVRVGHRGPGAFAVTGRSRIGARAFWAYAQQSAFIHARNASAARAHRMNIQHRNAHRKAVNRRL